MVFRGCRFFSSSRFSSHVIGNEKQELAGQPTPQTHPHLMSDDHVTPGLPLSEFVRRRKELANLLPAGCLAIVSAGHQKRFAHDIFYPFRTNTDFFYLTGVKEPESIMLLYKPPVSSDETGYNSGDESSSAETGSRPPRSHPVVKSNLYVRSRDPQKELWDGVRTGPERAQWMFGFDMAYPLSEFSHHVTRFAHEARTIFYPTGDEPLREMMHSLKTELNFASELRPIEGLVQMHRIFKSDYELDIHRQGADISNTAFTRAIQSTKPGMTEHQLQAILEFECKMRGATGLAYPPVVASGINANTLHYVSNDMVMHDGELVLVDAGSEHNGYCTDITRTWPVNGKFSPAQAEVYQHVLRAQKLAIEAARPDDNRSLNSLQSIAVRSLVESMLEMGVLQGSVQENCVSQAYITYYPHHVGHYLGLDVHDTAQVTSNLSFRPGMVITIEPGIYLPNEPHIPEKYRGIGVRIEDNIVITDGAPEVLTSATPKEIVDIERLMENTQ